MTKQTTLYLSDLKKGQAAIMTGFDSSKCPNSHFADNLRDRLMEMGFEINREIEVLQKGLIFGDPIAVKIGHMTIAIRKSEAKAITIKLESISSHV
jgi:ferrous iron transport protein A